MADEENKAITTEAEKKTAAPIDPTSLLTGYRVVQMIRGMRNQQKEDA